MKFLWVVAFKLHAPLLCRRAPAWTGRRRSRRTRFRAAVVRYTEVCHARQRQRGLLCATAASRPARALSSDALDMAGIALTQSNLLSHTNRSGRCLVGQRAGLRLRRTSRGAITKTLATRPALPSVSASSAPRSRPRKRHLNLFSRPSIYQFRSASRAPRMRWHVRCRASCAARRRSCEKGGAAAASTRRRRGGH